MVSFHELQELFLFSHAQGNLDDQELLLLYEEYSPKNLDFCYENFGRFSLGDTNDAECLVEFRFTKHDLSLLAEVLQILDCFTCYQRTVSSGIEALCILLRRLSYPCRFSDIIPRFDRPVPVLSMVRNKGVARGGPGVPVTPPFCKPFLTKQPRTGGENAMTFQLENVQTNEYPHFDTV